MKEIGEKLKEARESMGITIDEAASDLKIRASQVESIEDGDKDAFKDIFYLKMFIKNYSKYLGLDQEELVEEFNEYLFDYISFRGAFDNLAIDSITINQNISISGEDAIRSIGAALYNLDANEVLVVGHTDCGMASADADELKEKMKFPFNIEIDRVCIGLSEIGKVGTYRVIKEIKLKQKH